MGYDTSGLLDLQGRGVPGLFLVASISLLVVLIADLGFTGFRTGNLGLIVTAFLYIVTLISYTSLSRRVIQSDGHILDGALGFTIGVLALNIGNLLGGLQLSVLSSATSSYLSGILGQGQATVIPIVNIIFAPLGETFLIFGLTAGIYQLAKATDLVNGSPLQTTLTIGLIPSTIFAVLHGARNPQFLLMAFAINMFWTALIVYSDFGEISTKWVPAGLGLVAGLHVGFNSSNYGGILKFFNVMLTGGDIYVRSRLAILVFFGIMFAGGAFRVYQLVAERV